jgi:CheY-like chemotaxis protein
MVINDILDFSRIESGKLQVEACALDLRTCIEDAFDLVLPGAAAKRLNLAFVLADGVPRTIVSDAGRLRQVLVNLLGNAVKFTSQGEVVLRVAARAAGDRQELTFSVKDTGIGIPEGRFGVLFQSFSQVDGSIRRTYGGTGLGLAISKHLAIMLGGDIEIVSELGKGSSFALTFEAGSARSQGEGAASAPSAPAVASPVPGGGGDDAPLARVEKRVLLVEDGRLNQVLISTILRKAGADVVVTDNGEAGCEAALAARDVGAPFDLVLMDMQMPVLDGYGATRRLREEGLRVPIVALTAHAMAGDRQKCLEAGCSDYATKPIDRRALLRLCHRLTSEPPAALPARTSAGVETSLG